MSKPARLRKPGKNQREAIQNIKEAIEICVSVLEEDGLPAPDGTHDALLTHQGMSKTPFGSAIRCPTKQTLPWIGLAMITIDLPPDLESQLAHAARESGKNREEWARDIIMEYLEDMRDLREAEKIMRNHDPAKVLSLEQMMALYGMED